MVAWPNAWCAPTRQTAHTRNPAKSQILCVSGLLVGRSSRSEGELRKLAASYLGRNLGGFYSSRKSTTTFFPSDGLLFHNPIREGLPVHAPQAEFTFRTYRRQVPC